MVLDCAGEVGTAVGVGIMKKRKKKKIRKITIVTGGQKVPGLPFQGEMMTCVVCGKQERSDPKVESNWRGITLEKQTHYACTDEFPADDASREEFEATYLKVLLAIVKKRKETKKS